MYNIMGRKRATLGNNTCNSGSYPVTELLGEFKHISKCFWASVISSEKCN